MTTAQCPACFSALAPGTKFCPTCGLNIPNTATVPPKVAKLPPPRPSGEPPPGMETGYQGYEGKKSKGPLLAALGIGALALLLIGLYALVIAPANKRKAAEEDFFRFSKSHGVQEGVARELYRAFKEDGRGRPSYSGSQTSRESENQRKERKKQEFLAESSAFTSRVYNELLPAVNKAEADLEAARTADEKIRASKKLIDVNKTNLDFSRKIMGLAEEQIALGNFSRDALKELMTACKYLEGVALERIKELEEDLSELRGQ